MEQELNRFYSNHLKNFGATAQGVGWKNKDAQQIRFEQLLKIITRDNITINDLGCGTGDLVYSLQEKNKVYEYHGYDVMKEMVVLANKKFDSLRHVTFHHIKSAMEMGLADYTLASGIFNIRFAQDDQTWLNYILETLLIMNEKSVNGFAFNVLTKYSDAEFMKPELYYADPAFLFDHCKIKFSKNVTLLHDYNQYDFTILVRK